MPAFRTPTWRVIAFCLLAIPCGCHTPHVPSRLPVIVGGIPHSSETDFMSKWRPTFEEYLSTAIGHPFKLVQLSVDSAFEKVETGSVDFVFGNPSIASCLEAEFSVEMVATLRNSVLGDEASQFAGVMLAHRDNEQVNAVEDLKGKSLGASSIFVTGSGLLQWQELRFNGLDMFADSKHIRFVGDDQTKIVFDVLNRDVDVGFVRSGLMEELVAQNLTRWEDFKVINLQHAEKRSHSQTQVASTAFVPEWPLMATAGVTRELRAAVSSALTSISSSHAAVRAAGYSAWDLPKSYSSVSVSMWEVGILRGGHGGRRQCVRSHDLYDIITCPSAGHFKRSRAELQTRCAAVGLPCPDGSQCVCSPCMQADQISLLAGLNASAPSGLEVGACRKMEVCATVQQGDRLWIHLQDNLRRERDLGISLTLHADDVVSTTASPQGTDGTYRAELTTTRRGMHLLTVRALGQELPNSPFFVEVEDRDCAGDWGAESLRVADEAGECVCRQHTFEVNGICIQAIVLLRTLLVQLLGCVLAVAVSYFLVQARLQDDLGQLKIERSELVFAEPLEVIGKGQSGVVVKARFRGCDVAVKCFATNLHQLPGTAVDRTYSAGSGSTWAEWFKHDAAADTLTRSGTCQSLSSWQSDSNVQDAAEALLGAVNSIAPKGLASERGLAPGPILSSPRATRRLLRRQSQGAYPPAREEVDEEAVLTRKMSLEDTRRAASASAWEPSAPSEVAAGVRKLSDSPLTRNARQLFQREIRSLARLRHSCIATLMGVVEDGGPPLLVMELMEHGSLRALLNNKCLELDDRMVEPMTRDVIQGMAYLHASDPLMVHGDLKSDNILVDRNFRAIVSDFGLSNPQESGVMGTPPWMAPELLYTGAGSRKPTAKTDVYSFGIVLWELATREFPYTEELESGVRPSEILELVREGRKRPTVPRDVKEWMGDMMRRCWAQDPADRPSFAELDKEVRAMDIVGFHTAAMSCLERFKTNLHKSEAVLHDLFPAHVVRQLMEGKTVKSERKEEVTIFFSDIVGFTDLSAQLEPTEVSDMLHRLYQKLDALAKKHKVFKMGIIGDAWMGVTNIEGDQQEEHATIMAQFALEAVEAARLTPVREDDPSMGFVRIRGGFHSGPVVADVVGTHNLQYCLFGDTVNTASRMESTSEAMRVQCSAVAARKLHRHQPAIPLALRGRIAVKGKGTMSTFWVGEGMRGHHCDEGGSHPRPPLPVRGGDGCTRAASS